MRNLFLTILAIIILGAFGWTVYHFIAKRADQINSDNNVAVVTQETAPVVIGTLQPISQATAPAVIPGATPMVTAVAASTKTTTGKSATSGKTVTGTVPKTGPADWLLLALGFVALLAGAPVLHFRAKRRLNQAYRNQVIL